MSIAITGATGQLGQIVVQKLKAKLAPEQIVALARSPEKAEALGVPVRAFDYSAADATALQGVETLLLISGTEFGQRAQQHQNVIDAAKEAGVGHIVYTSVLNADAFTLPVTPEHVATEAALAASGVAHTILRNGWYIENYAMAIGAAPEHKAVLGAAGDGKIAAATREDYAEAAVAVLTDATKQGQTYELSGDVPFTMADLAAQIGTQTGESIAYVNMPEADYAGALVQAGLPEDIAGLLAACDTGISAGALDHQGSALSDLIGRPTTPLATVVRGVLSA